MRLVMPRWLLILEIMLIVAALGILAYKAATRITPLPAEAVQKARANQKAPARPTILDYYRKFPDRYIRVEDESWLLSRDTHAASHDFKLRNLATVGYYGIEVRITYEGSDGKTLLTHDIKIPGVLQGQATRNFKQVKVSGIPAATRNAMVIVAKALMDES